MKCAPRLEKRKNDGLKTDLKPLDLEANKIEGVLKSAHSRKEVTVYYKLIGGQLRLLTVKARYGQSFPER
jgi:hypothetical protein